MRFVCQACMIGKVSLLMFRAGGGGGLFDAGDAL